MGAAAGADSAGAGAAGGAATALSAGFAGVLWVEENCLKDMKHRFQYHGNDFPLKEIWGRANKRQWDRLKSRSCIFTI